MNFKGTLIVSFAVMCLSACTTLKTLTTQTYETVSVDIKKYDEEALDDYISGLKGIVQYLSAIQTTEPGVAMTAKVWLGLAKGQMQTAKIEIEEWPLQDRKNAWDIKGNRLKKLNGLIQENKDRILSNKEYDADLRSAIERIELLDESMMLSGSL